MEFLKHILDLFLHIDKQLADVITQYGTGTYGLLFLIIFCETGLVVLPFLPGDSLLFAAGAIVGQSLNVHLLVVLLIAAAILGDTTNYFVGRLIGKTALNSNSRWLKKEHFDKAHAFYEKHGGKALIFARFIPIVRTFMPFVAGVAQMTFVRFLSFSVAGGVLWVAGLTYLGFFFGGMEIVKKNFTLAIFAIIFISILPGLIEFARHMKNKSAQAAPEEPKA